MPQKQSNIPKRAANPLRKDTRTKAHTRGQERKTLRRNANEARHQANLAAGKTPKRQTRIRPRTADNPLYMRTCNRCNHRRIVAGSMCPCTRMGA